MIAGSENRDKASRTRVPLQENADETTAATVVRALTMLLAARVRDLSNGGLQTCNTALSAIDYQLVATHVSDGKGRRPRLAADILAVRLGRPPFSWGRTDFETVGDARRAAAGRPGRPSLAL